MTRRRRTLFAILLLLWTPARVPAHSGPPYPAISSRIVGGYNVAVWTDPDTTDDGSAQGKFWVTLVRANGGAPVDGRTRVEVSIRPTDRAGRVETAVADLVKADPATFYVTLTMDHEGPFAVHVAIAGEAGRAAVDCEVQATYDLRPARFLLVLYVLPFLAVAFLWAKLIIARRRVARPSRDRV